MDDLVNKVAERTGVGADTVRKVLESAIGFVKEKLPPQYASYVDNFASSGGSGGGGANLAGIVGGLFGGK